MQRREVTIEVLLNYLPFWHIGKRLYVMIGRPPNRFMGEWSGYFRCLCDVY